jgi:hypothetical protein
MSKRTPIRNVHTGDWLKSKAPTDDYREGWDRIFGQKPLQERQRPSPGPNIPTKPT